MNRNGVVVVYRIKGTKYGVVRVDTRIMAADDGDRDRTELREHVPVATIILADGSTVEVPL